MLQLVSEVGNFRDEQSSARVYSVITFRRGITMHFSHV